MRSMCCRKVIQEQREAIRRRNPRVSGFVPLRRLQTRHKRTCIYTLLHRLLDSALLTLLPPGIEPWTSCGGVVWD